MIWWPWLAAFGLGALAFAGKGTPAVDAIPLALLPKGDKRENAKIIERQAYAAGFDIRTAMAMIANAWRESGMSATAAGDKRADGTYQAYGLFQVHPWGGTIAQRQDPVYNTQIMLQKEALANHSHGVAFRAVASDPQATAGDIAWAWCVYLERPGQPEAQGEVSRGIVAKFWPGIM